MARWLRAPVFVLVVLAGSGSASTVFAALHAAAHQGCCDDGCRDCPGADSGACPPLCACSGTAPMVFVTTTWLTPERPSTTAFEIRDTVVPPSVSPGSVFRPPRSAA